MPILREKHTKEFFARCDECGLDFRGLFKEKDGLMDEIGYYSWTIKDNEIICHDCRQNKWIKKIDNKGQKLLNGIINE